MVWGANQFIDKASLLAKHLGVSDLMVGLTLIAFGTSAPEIFVGISGVLNGNEAIALGTAIGSNISNIALIFGVSCLFYTSSSNTETWYLMPFGLSVLLLGLALYDGQISTQESFGFVGLFMLFIYVLFKTGDLKSEDSESSSNLGAAAALTLVGLMALTAGSNVAIIYAESTALMLGISELVIGLTIIALGTSLPELAATVAALRRGKHQMVVGNIIGSNILNLAFVVPIIGFFGTVNLDAVVLERDFSVLACLSLVFVLLSMQLGNAKFKRSVFVGTGSVLICSYVAYISFLAGAI